MKRVTRISTEPRHGLRITFNEAGRSVEWAPADSAEAGTPQDVPDSIAAAIESDRSLAPHFRIESCEAETPAVKVATKATPPARAK